jgi:hypothetical protein
MRRPEDGHGVSKIGILSRGLEEGALSLKFPNRVLQPN